MYCVYMTMTQPHFPARLLLLLSLQLSLVASDSGDTYSGSGDTVAEAEDQDGLDFYNLVALWESRNHLFQVPKRVESILESTRLVRVARHAPTLADSDTGSVGVSVGGVTATSFSTPVTR